MRATTSKKKRTPAQLAAEGFAALVAKLGIADAIRFLHAHDPGKGNYTRDRSQWLDRLDIQKVVKLMGKTPRKRTKKS